MSWILFLLTTVLAAQAFPFRGLETETNELKKFVFDYRGYVVTSLEGLVKKHVGFLIESRVEFIPMNEKRVMLKIVNPRLYDVEGTWEKEEESLDVKRINQELMNKLKPVLVENQVVFKYVDGKVFEIEAKSELPDEVLNIFKGIINLIQIELKEFQPDKTFMEVGVDGKCDTTYTVFKTGEISKNIEVTKTRNLENCVDDVSFVKTSTKFAKDFTTPEKTFRKSSTFQYKLIEKTDTKFLIEKVVGRGGFMFVPFTNQQLTPTFQAKQILTTINIEGETVFNVPEIEGLTVRGDLMFKVPVVVAHEVEETNVIQHDIKEAIVEIIEEVKNWENIKILAKEMPEKFTMLVKYMKACNKVTVRALVDRYITDKRAFQVLFDVMASTPTTSTVKIVKDLISTDFDKVKFFLPAFFKTMSLAWTDEIQVAETLKEIMVLSKIVEQKMLKHAVWMTYGSIVNRICNERKTCPVNLIEPLLRKLEVAQQDVEDKLILIKAIANMELRKPQDLDVLAKLTKKRSEKVIVRAEAIKALKKSMIRSPTHVRSIVLPIFLNEREETELRIAAFTILMEETTETMLSNVAMVTVVAQKLNTETDWQLVSYVYSYFQSLANTTEISKRDLATAAKLALRFCKNFEKVTSENMSGVIHIPFYSEELRAGSTLEIHLIKKEFDLFPRNIIIKMKSHIFGRDLEIFELNIRTENLHRLIRLVFGQEGLNLNINNIIDWIKQQTGTTPEISDVIQRFISENLHHYLHRDEQLKPNLFIQLKLNSDNFFDLYLDEDILRTMINHRETSQMNIFTTLHKILELTRNGQYYFFKRNLICSESTIQVPTILGIPAQYNTTTASFMALKTDLKIEQMFNILEKLLLRRQIDLNKTFVFQPLYAMERFAYLGFDMKFVHTGILHKTNLAVVTPIELIKLNMHSNTNLYRVEFKLTEDKMNIVEFKDDLMHFIKKPLEIEGRTSRLFPSEGINQITYPEYPSQSTSNFDLLNIVKIMGVKFGIRGEAPFDWTLLNGIFMCRQPTGIVNIQMFVDPVEFTTDRLVVIELTKTMEFFKLKLQDSAGQKGFLLKFKVPEQLSEGFEMELAPLTTYTTTFTKKCLTLNVIEPNTKFTLTFAFGNTCQHKVISEIMVLPSTKTLKIETEKNFDFPTYMKRYTYTFYYVLERYFTTMIATNNEKMETTVHFTSPRTFDVRINLSDKTALKRDIELPFNMPFFFNDNFLMELFNTNVLTEQLLTEEPITSWNYWNRLIQFHTQKLQTIGKVLRNSVETFDGLRLPLELPPKCKFVLTKECTSQPQFAVLIHRPNEVSHKQALEIRIEDTYINLLPQLTVQVNDQPISFTDEFTLPNVMGKIVKEGTAITVTLPTIGILVKYQPEAMQTVTFKVAPMFHSSLCGILGNWNGIQEDDMTLPNQLIVHEPTAFVHSWLVKGCENGCDLEIVHKELLSDLTIGNINHQCFSAMPLLTCRQGCEAAELVNVEIGFFCEPAVTYNSNTYNQWMHTMAHQQHLQSRKYDTLQTIDVPLTCTCDTPCDQ